MCVVYERLDAGRFGSLMGNVIEPEQVADRVCFLASELSGVVYNLGA